MSRCQMLAQAIRCTDGLFARYVRDFDDTSGLAQPPGMPNHVRWTLGHLALTMHRVAERFDGNPLPEDVFVTGDGLSGDADRYDTESVCIGSQPIADDAIYPGVKRGLTIYIEACERFASAVGASDDARLEESIPWHDGAMPLWALVCRVCFHNGTHSGQIVDIRRALGMPNVIGAS